MADLARVAQTVAAAARGPAYGLFDRLCAACVRALAVEGAAISIMAEANRVVARAASDERVTRLEELQFTLGEGPGVTAFALGGPAWAADLLGVDPEWPVFVAEAGALVAGAGWDLRSVVALPLAGTSEPLGVVELYRRVSGEPGPDLLAQARIAVDAVVMAVLAAAAEERGDDGQAWLQFALADQVDVDQAVGMVMAQLGLSAEAALSALRGRAFALGSTLDELARAVIARDVRFHREDE